METIRKIYGFRAALICVLLLSVHVLYAKDAVISKSFKWSYSINPDATIELGNYDCDVTISSSTKNQVVLEIFIDAESKDQEDLDDLTQHLEQLSFYASPDKVELETTFWESRKTWGKNNVKMKLKDGPSINLTEFKIRANLSIPKTVRFDLNSKYSKIQLSQVNRLNLDSYDDEIHGSNVNGDVNIESKYSKIEFAELGPTEMDIYDCKINFLETADLEIESKYSDIIIERAEFLDVTSYDDNMKFKTTGHVKMTGKYSDFKSNTSGNLTLNIYDSDFEINEIGNLTINESKYSGYTFQQVDLAEITTTYDDVFKIGILVSMKANSSKYTDYSFEMLNKSFEIIEGYDDNIKIQNTSASFAHFDINCKYGKVDMKTYENLPLKIDWKTKHGKIEFDASKVQTRIKIKENSEYEFLGYRGSDAEDVPYVKVRGYDVKFNLVE